MAEGSFFRGEHEEISQPWEFSLNLKLFGVQFSL